MQFYYLCKEEVEPVKTPEEILLDNIKEQKEHVKYCKEDEELATKLLDRMNQAMETGRAKQFLEERAAEIEARNAILEAEYRAARIKDMEKEAAEEKKRKKEQAKNFKLMYA